MLYRSGSRTLPLWLSIAAAIGFAACDSSPTAQGLDQKTDSANGPQCGSPPPVCDPFGGGGSLGGNHGLLATLYDLPHDANGDHTSYNGVFNFEAESSVLENNLYFSQLNVPTRYFTQGFVAQDGSILTTPEGVPLYEYFGLRFLSVIQLTPEDSPGNYQFAILSDDGAILQVDPRGTGQMQVLINNDGDHPSLLGCATETIELSADSQLPIQLDYYQGPRYNIALILLWRKIDPQGCGGGEDLGDPQCGQEGNSLYFDDNQNPPAPQPAWLGLLQRGWSVVPPQNFFLVPPAVNPCPVGSPSPTPSASPSASPTPGPSVTPSPSPSPAPSPSPTPSPTPTPSVSPSPSPSPSSSPSPQPDPSPCTGPGCGGGVLGV